MNKTMLGVEILQNPQDIEVLNSTISYIDYVAARWSPPKTTSFYIEEELLERLDVFIKNKHTSKMELIALAVFEFIALNRGGKEKFTAHSTNRRYKFSVRIPSAIHRQLCHHAIELNVSAGEVINTSIRCLLERYK